ncbi:MAG: hypothetical protein VX874_22140 [Pseudomonadota bacterium]|nr:hypothetical protein [Pseudomonadota bacterium]
MTKLLPRLLRTLPIRAAQPPDPLDHPALSGLTQRELADLPRIAMPRAAQ